MTSSEQQHQRNSILDAIKNAWKADSAKVEEFGLVVIEAGIKPVASGWSIPVASGVPTGSAHELIRVIDDLQERIEDQTKLPVTLFLDPFTGKQVVSAPTKKAS